MRAVAAVGGEEAAVDARTAEAGRGRLPAQQDDASPFLPCCCDLYAGAYTLSFSHFSVLNARRVDLRNVEDTARVALVHQPGSLSPCELDQRSRAPA